MVRTKISEIEAGAVVAWSPVGDHADVIALGSKVRPKRRGVGHGRSNWLSPLAAHLTNGSFFLHENTYTQMVSRDEKQTKPDK